MGKLLSVFFLVCFCISSINAQENRKEKNARVEAMRVAYITEKLDLTVTESQLFWPIFNEYEAKRKKIQRSFERKRDIETMTNEETEDYILESFAKDQQMLDLKRTYFEKFKTAIPIKKIAYFPRIEKKFRQELLKRMRQGKEGQGRRN